MFIPTIFDLEWRKGKLKKHFINYARGDFYKKRRRFKNNFGKGHLVLGMKTLNFFDLGYPRKFF
jgi:hypothetical protein